MNPSSEGEMLCSRASRPASVEGNKLTGPAPAARISSSYLTHRSHTNESQTEVFPQEHSLLPALKDRKPKLEASQPSAVNVAEATEDLRDPLRNVKRGISRGTDERSRKEVRDSEDAVCNCGIPQASWPGGQLS